jgi:hypothetical protein
MKKELTDLQNIWEGDNAVGIATGHRLDGQGDVVQVPVGARFFSPPCQDRFCGPPSSYPMVTRGSFLKGRGGESR